MENRESIINTKTSRGGTTRIPEILAPAGGREQFFAALHSGADAVYLGLKAFNARSRADNFTVEDLRELVPLAHRHAMKVLVTVNILVKDMELASLIQTLGDLESLKIDAIIVQDVGVARIARRHFPGLRLHASTQMAIHNLAGVMQALEWGFKRVVLARELTAPEIKKIRAAISDTDLEIEAFCHGSLCYSYSGLCFFSGANDARSGNRGECAYTCRQPYKIISEPGQGFLFSMKDLDTTDDLQKFIDADVHTLKIEGRKKDAQYVSSVVKVYRRKLDELFGYSTLRAAAPRAHEVSDGPRDIAGLREDLNLSFQRKPTSLFLNGRYRENVIDLDNPTHAGVLLGRVLGLVQRNGTHLVRTKLATPLERFDGIRIASGHTEKGQRLRQRFEGTDIQFSVREIYVSGKRVAQADADSEVELALDAESQSLPAVGEEIFKTRSADLKRRVDQMTKAPVGERLRQEIVIDWRMTLYRKGSEQIRLCLTANDGQKDFASGEFVEAFTKAQRPGQVEDGLRREFATMGPQAEESAENACFFLTKTLTFDADCDAFIAPSRLKEIKRSMRQRLVAGFTSSMESKIQTVSSAVLATHRAVRETSDLGTYVFKIDRPEYLTWLRDDGRAAMGDSRIEIVFEPKRHLLGNAEKGDWLEEIHRQCVEWGVDLRIAIPTILRGWDEPLLHLWLQKAWELGVRAYEVGNPGALYLVKKLAEENAATIADLDLSGDMTLYALNREAVWFWREQGIATVTLSIEDDAQDIQSLLAHWPQGSSDIKPQAILYKDTPLFIAESCSLTALHNGCPSSKVCGYRPLVIENSKGEQFTVAHESCKSIVFGAQAYSIAQHKAKLESWGVRHFRADFLTRAYTREEILDVSHSMIRGQKPSLPSHPANFEGVLL